MKVHIFQHVPFEDAGCMSEWLREVKADVAYTRFFENASLPRAHGLDLVIIMGGPMSANDEEALPWLRAEKEFIRAAAASGAAVLGVCLGAQLIACALGAKVYKNPQKEIGWFNVGATPHTPGTFGFPATFPAFHWHGETFDLPPGAVRLAESEACANQAFQIGRIIGLQFHLEVTPGIVKGLVENCSGELVPAPYIQPASALQSAGLSTYSRINSLMDAVLSYLAGGPGRQVPPTP